MMDNLWSRKHRYIWQVALFSLIVVSLAAGCATTADFDALQQPDHNTLQEDARESASTAVSGRQLAYLMGGAGQVDQKSHLTLSGFREQWPLTISLACRGHGEVRLSVDGRPVLLSCDSGTATVFDGEPDLAKLGTLTVTVTHPAVGPAAWGVSIFAASKP